MVGQLCCSKWRGSYSLGEQVATVSATAVGMRNLFLGPLFSYGGMGDLAVWRHFSVGVVGISHDVTPDHVDKAVIQKVTGRRFESPTNGGPPNCVFIFVLSATFPVS